jgi:hypothetical protein
MREIGLLFFDLLLLLGAVAERHDVLKAGLLLFFRLFRLSVHHFFRELGINSDELATMVLMGEFGTIWQKLALYRSEGSRAHR